MHVNVPVFSGEGAHCERNRKLCLFCAFDFSYQVYVVRYSCQQEEASVLLQI